MIVSIRSYGYDHENIDEDFSIKEAANQNTLLIDSVDIFYVTNSINVHIALEYTTRV